MAGLIFSLFPIENFFELTIYQFGYEQCRPLHTYGPAVRNHFLFHYILSGQGSLLSTDSKGQTTQFVLKENEGFLLWPEQNNTYTADAGSPWEYAWIEFDGLKARELMIQAGLLFDSPVYTARGTAECGSVKDELMYIVNHADRPPLELMGHFYLFANALILSSASRKNAHSGSLREFYVREAISYIEQHYQENITVEDIAASCNLNRSYLSKIFKSVMATAPQDFLIRYRMEKACALMKITNLSIREISHMVGYPNSLNFSRAFKREFGKPPQTWRQQILK